MQFDDTPPVFAPGRFAVTAREKRALDQDRETLQVWIVRLLAENRQLRRRLKAAQAAVAEGDQLRPCRDIARRKPIETHVCNAALPKHIKEIIRQDGCLPEYELGVGNIVLTTCEATRLVEALDKTDGCWEWVGQHHPTTGYGIFAWDGRGWMAHRFMYALLVGPIPFGYTIDHLCRNRACVKPEHLEAVTQGENVRRKPLVRIPDPA